MTGEDLYNKISKMFDELFEANKDLSDNKPTEVLDILRNLALLGVEDDEDDDNTSTK